VPFTLTGSYLASILLGRQEVGVFSLRQIIEKIFFLVVFFGLIFVLTDKLILNAVIANLSSVIAGWIIAIILVSRRTRIGLCLQRSFVALITKYGTKVYVANMMIFGERKLDVFIINFFLNPTMVGYYSLATGIAEFLRYIPKSVSMMLFPKIASSSTTDANVYTPIVCRHMLFITAICCIGIGLISKMIIKFVYGDAFLPAAPVVWVFLPGMIFFSLSRVLLSDLLGRGKPIYGTIASSISAISSICFNFLLIPIWGMFGAAAAAVLSYFLMFVILLWFYLKVSGNKLIDMFWFAKEDFIVYINIIREILKRSRILKRNEEKD
jgi:O-antigen/teichoic acid export membrane protein